MEEYKDRYTVINTPTGCKELQGFTKGGWRYPKCKDFNGKLVRISRWLYESVYGPIPEGMVIMHTCDNPACINLDHLAMGTHADNVADKMSKNRQAKGEASGRAKLTEVQVREIRVSTEPNSKLAKKYGVDHMLIVRIKRRDIWKHID